MSSNAIIEAQDLTKVFRDFWHRPKVRAVNGLSFEVKPGEVFGLLGPNGSGKTTTLKMILGLLYPTRGTLHVLNQSPRDVKTKARVGYLPEESYLYPYLTSEETLTFYGRLFDLNRRERKQRIEQLLEMIGLQHARSRMVGEFSKGMTRRIGLAQALINDPDLVVLDEPTAGLDPIGCRQVKDLIVALAKRGKTILLSSHLLADVEDVCDRVAILYNGQFQAMGPINDLLEVRSRCQLTVPQMEPDVLKRVLAAVREVLGEEPEITHPRKDLEQFFLGVVEKARKEAKEASGVGAEAEVADYLAQENGLRTDEKLQRLVATPPPKETRAPEPPNAQDKQDEQADVTPSTEADQKLKELLRAPDRTDDSDE